jgi:Flp pilus assembly protein TadG
MKEFRTKNKKGERGSMLLLFSVIVLPLLFLSFTLSVDLTTFYSEANNIQKLLDEAALQGYRSLPYKEEAKNVTTTFLTRHAPSRFSSSADFVVSTTGDTVTLGYSGLHELFFPKLFLTLTGAADTSSALPLNTLSKVRGTPFDVFIALDASGTYLAPPVTSLSPWGSPLEWPSAQFFETHPVFLPTGTVHKRVATEQCFNEPFSSLKTGALRAYEYFSAFDSDQVGVGVYPGGNRELALVRGVRTRDSRAATPSGSRGEADFLNVNGIGRRDTYCAAAAEAEVNTERYRFPAKNLKLSSWTPEGGSPPASMVVPPSFSLNPYYQDFQSVRESLWSLAARDGAPGSFDKVFPEALSALFSAPALSQRGTLVGSATKVLFFFGGDVPWVNGVRFSPGNSADTALRQKFTELRDQILTSFINEDFELAIYYVVFDHGGQSSPVSLSAAALQGAFNSFLIPGSKKIKVQVFAVQSGQALERQLLPLLLLNHRAAFIKG